MNRWLAIGLGTVATVAAVALYYAGQPVAAGIAFGAGVLCDAWFVLASRGAVARMKEK